MLINELPRPFNPAKLCKSAPPEGFAWEGQLQYKNMPDLEPPLRQQGEAVVHVRLNFHCDSEKMPVITGEISSLVSLICQRCLEPMEYELKAEFAVSPVNSDTQAEQLPPQYEPLLTEQGEVSLPKWIAEELHLALPLAPIHDPRCKPRVWDSESDDKVDSDSREQKQKPFAKLALLKTKK